MADTKALADDGTKFVSLPRPRVRLGKFEQFAKDLRESPGRWAVYPGRVTSEHSAECTVWVINTNRRPLFPARSFEARVHNGMVYVRARKK
jgi:hypothetical protein